MLQVAAYCRVSTDKEDQANSFEAQQRYFREYIQRQPDWELQGIYADEGFSGTSTNKRVEFNKMLHAAELGQIDLIVTKEVSRFTRNTVDALQITRELRRRGVGVLFLNDSLDTRTNDGELRLTIMSSFAQDESRRTSERSKWGQMRSMEKGVVFGGSLLGYDVIGGKMTVNPEGAEVVRLIFHKYLQERKGCSTIARELREAGILSSKGNCLWSSATVTKILKNEKYCGDVLLQKTFTDNVLTGGPKKNTGQLPQYYIENNHEGIVTKRMYRAVQAEIARRNSKSCANQRKKKRGRYNSKYALSERLYCGECGSPYKRVTWNIHGRKEIVWRCVNRVTYGTKFCHNSPSVQEEALHQTLLRAIQNLTDNYTEEVAMQINGILHDLQGGTTELEKLQQKLADSQQEFDRLLDMSLECDASFLDEKLKHASEEIDNLQKQVDQLTASQQKAANPNLQLTDSDFRITEYSDTLVARIIERIEVISAVRIKIEFIGGYTVTVPLQS